MAEVENTQRAVPNTLAHWSHLTGTSAQHPTRATDVSVGLGPVPTLRRPLAMTNYNAPLANPTKITPYGHSNALSQSKPFAFDSSSLHARNSFSVQRSGDSRSFSRVNSTIDSVPFPQAVFDTTVVGAIGDGRKRVSPRVHLEPTLQSEMEQTASLLRSLDLTPPVPAMGNGHGYLVAHTVESHPRFVKKSTNPEDEKPSIIQPQNLNFDPFSSKAGPPSHFLLQSPDNDPGLPRVNGHSSLTAEEDYFLNYAGSGRLVPSEFNLLENNQYQPITFAANLAPSTTKSDLIGTNIVNPGASQHRRLPPTTLGRTADENLLLLATRSSTFIPSTSNSSTMSQVARSESEFVLPGVGMHFTSGNAQHIYDNDPSPRTLSSHWSDSHHMAPDKNTLPKQMNHEFNGDKHRLDGWVSSASADTQSTHPINTKSLHRPVTQAQRLQHGTPATWLPHTPVSRSEGSSNESDEAPSPQAGNEPIPTLPTPRTSPRESVSSSTQAEERGHLTRAGPAQSSDQLDLFAQESGRYAAFDPLMSQEISKPYAPISRRPVMFSTMLGSTPNEFFPDSGPRLAFPTALHKTPAHTVEDDEPLNFLQLLQPNTKPPYHLLVHRVVTKSDQQASIFIQQKLKNAGAEERSRIVQAIAERGLDMMQGRFGNWCVQRCLEAPCSRVDRMKIVECMSGHIVELSTNCYGTHVVQKALECEEDIKRIIVNELLDNEPAYTLTSKHCSHVWAKIMEINWVDSPAPPIFNVVNRSLRGKWASLACHETGSLVVQTIFENMDDTDDKLIIVDEILTNLSEVVKNQWGAFVIQHIIEHGDAAVSHRTSLSLICDLAVYGVHDIAVKSILKILKEKDPITLDATITKMCEPNTSGSRNKRPIIVDLALSANGSQVIQAVLPEANKDQRARLYDAIKGHTVTLRGCKTGSRVIWLFDRMVNHTVLT
ncbi:hypothetical protein FRB91_002426 [Serendipita sp. 411]|nr:hypothetical protein FRC18_003154 [Serendipita sp. 400]KAG8855233.1 hypothetical protein FRB91_002426 [Serendipita sp. 411]